MIQIIVKVTLHFKSFFDNLSFKCSLGPTIFTLYSGLTFPTTLFLQFFLHNKIRRATHKLKQFQYRKSCLCATEALSGVYKFFLDESVVHFQYQSFIHFIRYRLRYIKETIKLKRNKSRNALEQIIRQHTHACICLIIKCIFISFTHPSIFVMNCAI